MTNAKREPDTGLLGIYLNDHLAGSMAGTELARRISRTHRELRTLATDVEADQRELQALMRDVGVSVQRHKAAAGWLTEKLGRLKLNGRLLSRSPLSDLLELETMRLGINGKAAMWLTLRAAGVTEEARLDRLVERADAQANLVEEHRIRVARTVFGEPAGSLLDVDVNRTFTVSTSPDAVVEYLRDFSRTEQWDPGTVECTRLDEGPVEVGARWRNVSKFLGRRTELVYELTRCEPSHLRFVGHNDTATTTDDITLSEGDAPGTTTIGYHAHVEFRGLAKLGAPAAKLALEKQGTDTEKNLTRILGPA